MFSNLSFLIFFLYDQVQKPEIAIKSPFRVEPLNTLDCDFALLNRQVM